MGLKYTDMSKIIQMIAELSAISTGKGNQETLSDLNPFQTALFFGVKAKSMCSVREREAYRRRVRHATNDLLDMGVTTIIAEISTIFGYYALDELIRQRNKHNFTLILLQQENKGYHWLRTNRKLARIRARRNVHNCACCDCVLSSVKKDEWRNLLNDHICLAIMEKPLCYRNRKVLSTEQYTKWPPFDEEKVQKMIRWLLNDEAESEIVCQTKYIRS